MRFLQKKLIKKLGHQHLYAFGVEVLKQSSKAGVLRGCGVPETGPGPHVERAGRLLRLENGASDRVPNSDAGLLGRVPSRPGSRR
jgi:hypothetical protein